MGMIPLRIYHLFIVFWLHWVFVAVHRFSLVWQAGVVFTGSQASYCSGSSSGVQARHTGFSSCNMGAQ